MKKGIYRPKAFFPGLPSTVDKLLKNKFDNYRKKGELPPELATLKEDNNAVQLFNDQDKLEEWRDYKRGLRWKDEKGNVLFGAIDDLLIIDGKFVILDYKTKGDDNLKVYDAYQRQMDLYTYLLSKMGFNVDERAYLLFFWPLGLTQNNTMMFSTRPVEIKTSIKNAESILKEVDELLSKDTPPKASSYCSYCKWTKQTLDYKE